jgi:hypothetical protein
MKEFDRSDPGVRAVELFDRGKARDRSVRTAAGLALGTAAVAAPFVAAPVTGSSGATVGAVVGALLLAALAAVVWPYEWSSAEEQHRRLEAIWREVRTDADAQVPWDRYAAWVEPGGGQVELVLIRCAPAARRVAGAPTPYSRKVVRRLEADDVATAAEAMEELRAEASDLEFKARQDHSANLAEAERRAHEETLRGIDEEADAYQRAADERAQRELAEQDAAEREAQAAALARALRRP